MKMTKYDEHTIRMDIEHLIAHAFRNLHHVEQNGSNIKITFDSDSKTLKPYVDHVMSLFNPPEKPVELSWSESRVVTSQKEKIAKVLEREVNDVLKGLDLEPWYTAEDKAIEDIQKIFEPEKVDDWCPTNTDVLGLWVNRHGDVAYAICHYYPDDGHGSECGEWSFEDERYEDFEPTHFIRIPKKLPK